MAAQRSLQEIFQRYVNNECTVHEVKFLLAHFKVDDNEDVLRALIAGKLSEYQLTDMESEVRMHQSFDDTFDSILNRIEKEERIEETDGEEIVEKKNLKPFMLRLMAGLTVVVIVFEIFYSTRKTENAQPLAAVTKPHQQHAIKPGGNKAILTLQDGSTIVLDEAENGTVARQGGATVVKMANGQLVYNGQGSAAGKVMYNTMSTPRGGQYKLTLPDGTAVWLNSASSITYPTAFVGKERNVSITGEAYFEVAKDKTHPFHVKAGEQNIEVLGTHFNVMAYADEDAIKTTLIEGSVKVTEKGMSGVLKPGEQAVNKDGELNIGPAAIDEALAWKNGYFKFNRVGIKYIMRQLARWYDVEVVYEGRVKDDEFVGTIGRGESITQALHLLELTNVHFKIQDKKIIVLPY